MSTQHHVRHLLLVLIIASSVGAVRAEPCLLVYPLSYTIFQYNPGRYIVLDSSDDRYDPSYGIDGKMLWDLGNERVALEVYQAPQLGGFVASPAKTNQFFTTSSFQTIVVDGFSDRPRRFTDVCLQFTPLPLRSKAEIFVNGERVDGLRHVIPWFVVSTPTEHGFYSDQMQFKIDWVGAQRIEVIAYADRNGDRVFDGEPCFSVVMEDRTVSTENRTWGNIKALYESD